MAAREQVNIKLTPAVKKRLQRYASERKLTVSGAVRAAVLEQTKVGGRPTYDELLDLLGEQARVGNVAAIREMMAYYDRKSAQNTDQVGEFDELAARRSA